MRYEFVGRGARSFPGGLRTESLHATGMAIALSILLLSVSSPSQAQDATSAARFDAYGVKGWNFPFPSAADSLIQDAGGFRSALAEYGFGFLNFNVTVGGVNAGGTPHGVPDSSFVPSLGRSLPYPECSVSSGPICRGGQTYFGQRPSYYNVSLAYLTYDTSRWGIPDGQIVLGATKVNSSYQDYFPTTDLGLMGLSWYQTLFNKRLELKVGYTTNNQEFVGTYVGGSFANPFGPTASVPVQLGMSIGPTPTPSIRATVHLTSEIYNSTAVQRSLPINGRTGNPIKDELDSNPSGFKLRVPNAGTLYINELGYKNDAAPNRPHNWVRAGVMYNTSEFRDYSRFSANPAATTNGSWGIYVLGDRQLWQQAPGSPYSAYRGLYAGLSYMYAPPKNVVFSQYLEGRLYWIGPFDSRPTDMLSFVYSHNRMSGYLVNTVNSTTAPLADQGYPVPRAARSSNSYSLSYLAHITPGLYASLAGNYTDKPSFQYFAGQGSAWTVQLALTTVF
ncbi:carbohydrate porin [Burkholderia diffusa]|uniref:carbohydrate porin n=1 Tax=Burkholderia diffusa TaxID=488732 RepID=UPI0009BEF31E|nr:carbohydrate porin [Burkholderia diffusa]